MIVDTVHMFSHVYESIVHISTSLCKCPVLVPWIRQFFAVFPSCTYTFVLPLTINVMMMTDVDDND